MKVFWQNYHISVNDCIVNDMIAAGLQVVVPDESFANKQIHFFAPNNEHYDKPNVVKVTYDEFLTQEPMAIVINCSQLYEDMIQLYRDRGCVDQLVVLSSQMGLGEWIDEQFKKDNVSSDFLISHSLNWHRKSKAPYKIMYFNRPKQLVPIKTPDQMHEAFDKKQIKLYINHFETALAYLDFQSFDSERAHAQDFREKWQKLTNWRIPFYGYENVDGYLTMQETQDHITDSMFTLVFKGHETWGQMVNESMQMGTPCIFLKEHTVDMFTEYLITPETAVIGTSVDQLIKKIKNMSYEEYENLCHEASWHSRMYTNAEINREKLAWLFSKVAMHLNVV